MNDSQTQPYLLYLQQLQSICEGVDDTVSILANASAFLNEILTDTNWVGFYLVKNKVLKLNAFQGKVACTVIEIGKGVCGHCVATKKIQRIANVHEFPGHIACDSASNSEIVLPIVINNHVFGVLDIDSPSFDRFSIEDELFLSQCVTVIEHALSNCHLA